MMKTTGCSIALLLSMALSGLNSCMEPSKGKWQYIAVESTKQKWGDWNDPDWLRYFGLDYGDINRDGFMDILSGRYLYINPGDPDSAPWHRMVLDDNVDAILHLDVDGDQYFDLIAQSLPDLYWYEAVNLEGNKYRRQRVAEVPATSHVNSQGFEKADIIPGDQLEILIAGNGNVYLISIPKHPEEQSWPSTLIAANTSDEGIGVGDLDGDGDLDIAAGRRPQGEDEPTLLYWYENPGNPGEQSWKDHAVGTTANPIDRIAIADLNGDDQSEIVITEERYPGLEPDANLYWFDRNASSDQWNRHHIAQQYSSNNLDLADIDDDGDIDLLTAEHKGPSLEVQFWINDGRAKFTKQVVDTGRENHLGTQLVDIEGDGDLDIIGAGWDQHQWIHLWINESLTPDATPVNTGTSAQKLQMDDHQYLYEGRPHFVIQTPGLTYYYDVAGGGFSRLIDNQGNDWIAYKNQPWGEYPASAASAFRGLPNLVYRGEDDGAGHPGHDKCKSWIDGNRIVTETKNGRWRWSWEFFDHHSMLHVIKSDPERPYWFLYEGTPGGRFDPGQTYFGTNMHDAPSHEQYDYYLDQQLYQNNLSWMYAGVNALPRVFYMLHLQADNEPDLISMLGNSPEGLASKDGMTIWGFGRDQETNPMMKGEQRFIIGMYPKAITNSEEHQGFGKFIEQNFTDYAIQ